jgi:acyl-CoA synthetase (NDP forming)
MSLDHLFRPDGIAVVGASDRRTSNGFIVTNNLINNRYAGRIVPVNPRLDQLLGLPAAPSLLACAGQVDLAVLMVRSELVASVYMEAARSGVKAVSIAGDLPADKRGLDVISGVLADGGPRILGPGSVGTIDCPRSVMASMSSALLGRRLIAGGLSIVSQSGGLLGTLLNRAADHGIGISKAVSLGQEFDIGLGELLGYLADDPETTTIACVLEGLRQPQAFVDGVRRAHRNGKQVSVFRIGRSTAGQQSALAHSGALAVPNRTYAGLFDQLGVLQVDSNEDLLAVVYADPSIVSAHGRAVGVASLSGGCCGAFADACEAEGLQLARLVPETIAAAGLPAGQLGNPLDLVSNAVGPEVTEQVLAQGLHALEADAEVGAVVYADSILLPIDAVADTLIQRHCERRKPLVVAWDLGSQGAQAFARLQQAGVPTFRSLRVAARWLQLSLRDRHTLHIDACDPDLLASVTAALDSTQEVSTEAELSPALVRLGIPMASSRLVHSSTAVGDAADTVGTPVAVKVISPRLLHRHAVGAVALNLKSREDAVLAAEALLAQHPMAGTRDGLLVQRMVGIGDEYFIGLHRDAHFGLLLLFGRGGVNVERDGKVVARRLPMTGGEIAEMVAEVDEDGPIAAISEVAYRLAELGQSLSDRLLSLEINPLVTPVHAPDTVVGLDALATFAIPPQTDPTTPLTSIDTTEDTYV